MDNTSTYYQPFQSASIIKIIPLLLISILIAACLGYAYSIAIIEIPYIKLLVIVSGLLGFIIGTSVTNFGQLMGLKPVVTATVGFMAGCVALAVSWFFWLLFVSYGAFESGDYMGVIKTVLENQAIGFNLVDQAIAINKTGTWSLDKHGALTNGQLLSLIWLAEALIIVGLATFAGLLKSQNRVKCPRCKQKTEVTHLPMLVPVENKKALKRSLEQGDLNVLTDMPRYEDGKRFTRVDVHACQCGGAQFVSVFDQSSKNEKNQQSIVHQLNVSDAGYQALVSAHR